MFLLPLLLSFWSLDQAAAASSFEVETLSEKHHVTADRTLYHSKENVYEAFGHVVVSSQGQRLSSDYLWLDDNTKEMKARGNVVMVDHNSIIQAAELHFSLLTGFGSIFYGKISSDQYSLKGQLIRRVSEDHFLTTEGEYTTCKDCAESWKLSARDVDLTINGYAFMDNVFVKIKDVPALYIPYLVVPVKTKRQSGFLFPKLGAASNKGFVYVQPFYWAIDSHEDATISLGRYTAMGTRGEAEHRYKLPGGIQGQTNVYVTGDRQFKNQLVSEGYGGSSTRLAIVANHKVPISDTLDFKLRVYEVTDQNYVQDFPEDIAGNQFTNLESNASGTAHFDSVFLSVAANRYRNLLYDRPIGFDTSMVQDLPTTELGLKPIQLFGPVYGEFYGRYDRFTRGDGTFYSGSGAFGPSGAPAFNPAPGSSDLIREANRFYLQPKISAPFMVGNFLSVAPSVQMTDIEYSFNVPQIDGSKVPNTGTRYAEAQIQLSTTFEKTFDVNSEKVSKLQHQLIPFLTFSNIPWIQAGKPDNPFNGTNGQINSSYGVFDQFDVIPNHATLDYLREPEGKSLYYGFTSHLVTKMKTDEEMRPKTYPYDLMPSHPKSYPAPQNRKQELANEQDRLYNTFDPHYKQYQDIWTVTLSQAYDLRQQDATDPTPGAPKPSSFGYLLAKSDINLGNFSNSTEWRYFPTIADDQYDPNGSLIGTSFLRNKQFFTTAFTWYIQNLANLRRTRIFLRSVSASFSDNSQPNPSRTASLNVNWSFNDFASARLNYDYDLLGHNQLDWSTAMILTHPSECWGFMVDYNWLRYRELRKGEVGVQLLLNPFGTGFLGNNQANMVGPTTGNVFGSQ